MMYPFLTLDDGTEIVHSNMLPNGEVKVYIEKPDEKKCFRHATCYLPSYRWEDIDGFTKSEIEDYQKIIASQSDIVIQKWEKYFGETRYYC